MECEDRTDRQRAARREFCMHAKEREGGGGAREGRIAASDLEFEVHLGDDSPSMQAAPQQRQVGPEGVH